MKKITIAEYTSSLGTPFHILGGLAFTFCTSPEAGGILWGICMLFYQLFDAFPGVTPDYEHTKWDVLEIGFGAMAMGIIINMIELVVPMVIL
jgi:hypothetical protein